MALLFVPGSISKSLALLFTVAQGFLCFLYTYYYHGKYGQTIGKRWLKIMVLTTNGSPISFVHSIRRNIILFIESIPWTLCTIIAISRIPTYQYYTLHGHVYNQLERSLRPE